MREEIGPDEKLSRHVWDPSMVSEGIIEWRFLFEFPDSQCESVIWHRHVDLGLAGIHEMGCERQKELRQKQIDWGKIPNRTYVGAATAQMKDISEYRNPHGHGVLVVHEPKEGPHHVHLCYYSEPGSPSMNRADKNEIKFKLAEIFQNFSPHRCLE